MRLPKTGELWKHYKKGTYVIVGITTPGPCPVPPDYRRVEPWKATIEDTEQETEIYVNFDTGERWVELNSTRCYVLYTVNPHLGVWAREIGNFLEYVDDSRRFTPVR